MDDQHAPAVSGQLSWWPIPRFYLLPESFKEEREGEEEVADQRGWYKKGQAIEKA